MSLALFLASALAFDPATCDQNPEAQAVQARRMEFNGAIQSGNLDVIEDILDEDAILITGTWSDLFHGRQEQLDIWQDDFDQGEQRMIYLRTPGCIRSSSITAMATEHGHWKGEDRAGNVASGSYSAKWRLKEDRWQLEAEIFMTEDCAGSACPD